MAPVATARATAPAQRPSTRGDRLSMVPPSAARDGEVAWTFGEERGSVWCGSDQEDDELVELDELAVSFLFPDVEDEELDDESLFDDDSLPLEPDFDSEPDDSLPLEPDFEFDF